MIAALLIALALAADQPAVPSGPPYPITVPLSGTYDPANPFARILRGELPAARVWEDRDTLAFMDHQPVTEGHVLIISRRRQSRNLLEADDREVRRLMAVARRIGRAQVAALGADGFSIEQNNGFGQTVGHLHIHVIPRYADQPWAERGMARRTPAELEAVAARIRAALK